MLVEFLYNTFTITNASPGAMAIYFSSGTICGLVVEFLYKSFTTAHAAWSADTSSAADVTYYCGSEYTERW